MYSNFFQNNKKDKCNLQKYNKSSSAREFSQNDEGHITDENIQYVNREKKQDNVKEFQIKSENCGNYACNEEACTEVAPTLLPQVIGALACAFVQLCLGVVLGYTGIILPALTAANSTDIYLNTSDVALFSGLNYIGTMIGALSAGVIMTWIGQRVILLFTLPLGAIAWIIKAYSYTLVWLMFSRFIIGLVAGVYIAATNNYVAEISHTSVRGRLLALNDLFRHLGSVFVAVVGSTSLNWRYVGLVCGLTTLIPPIFALFFLPNSPRWLATVNRKEEARASLMFFRGSSYDVEKELNEIFSQINRSSSDSCLQSLKIFREKSILKRFITLCVMAFLIQFTGNLVIISYSVLIFKATDTDVDEYMITMISGLMRALGAFTYFIVADKFRRKILLTIPLMISGFSTSILGLYFYLMLHYDVQSFYWMPSFLIILEVYSTGMYYPVFMLIRTELLPTSIRPIATGLLLIVISIGMFIVVFFYPYMVESIGYHFSFWIYGIITLFVALIVLLFIPETKDKTLEEIERIK